MHRSAEAWAAPAGLSRRTLPRRFPQETGLGLALWRRRARLLKSLEWLAEGRPVTTVAFAPG